MQVRLDRVRWRLNGENEPEFRSRARNVVGLYLNPPAENAMVLPRGETMAIRPKRRCYPDQLPTATRFRRLEFEYRHHRTMAPTASLDVHGGKVLTRGISRSEGSGG